MDALATAYEQVKSGAIEIRPDGSIWRVRKVLPLREDRPLANQRRIDTLRKRGHRSFSIRTGGVDRTVLAHRLIYLAHHNRLPDKTHIVHRNNDLADNRIENLAALAFSDNTSR